MDKPTLLERLHELEDFRACQLQVGIDALGIRLREEDSQISSNEYIGLCVIKQALDACTERMGKMIAQCKETLEVAHG